MTTCPCGTGNDYQACCEPFILDNKLPATPLQLMRSRYTAYTLARVDYIANTMKSPASDDFDLVEAKAWATQTNWLGLKIIKSTADGDIGQVEFVASFQTEGDPEKLHELSSFKRIEGKWFYVDGVVYS